MIRVLISLAMAIGTVAVLASMPLGSGANLSDGLPPAEPRPPGLRNSALWLTELKRYQYARRKSFSEGTEFRQRLDLGRERASRRGRYRAVVLERPEPLPVHGFHAWRLRLEDAAGQPVAGAALNVSARMPEHGHGMPVRPKARAGDAPGEYLIEGLQFSMPGWWELHVYVSRQRIDDIVTFNVFLD